MVRVAVATLSADVEGQMLALSGLEAGLGGPEPARAAQSAMTAALVARTPDFRAIPDHAGRLGAHRAAGDTPLLGEPVADVESGPRDPARHDYSDLTKGRTRVLGGRSHFECDTIGPVPGGGMNVRQSTAQRAPERTVRIVLDPRNIWRIGFVVIALLAVVALGRFVLAGGSGLLFTVLMAWFASLAIEPAVGRLSHRMRRGAATGLVMLAGVAFLAVFLALFGQLFVNQVARLVEGLPELVASGVDWANATLGTAYDFDKILADLSLTPERAASVAAQVAGGVLSVVGSVVGAVGTFFMFALLLFYLSADGPRLRRWIASLFPPHIQEKTVAVWDTTAEKTGRYVAARVVLALINSTASGIVFVIIGLPSWLALAIWTGLVAQFVPVIGTYISIVLPVIVGLLSPNPWLGLIVLGWAVVYQQIENLTIEPRISARAVNVHPAVSFASVILGTALFGVAGALLAIPIVAMLLALLDLYRTRYDVLPALDDPVTSAAGPVGTPGSDGA